MFPVGSCSGWEDRTDPWNDCLTTETFRRREQPPLERWEAFPFVTDGSIEQQAFLAVRQHSLETLRMSIAFHPAFLLFGI